MVQRCQHFSFPLKSGHSFGIAEHCCRQDFERHVPLELRVPRAVHFAHPALAEQGKNFVVTDFVPDRKRHLAGRLKFSRSVGGCVLHYALIGER